MAGAEPREIPLVLVVEDEPSFAEALEVGLRGEGFDAATATDGRAAIEAFDRLAPDLVLLDLMLPRLSGTEVCRQLRERSRVPIIVVTARASEVDTVLSLELGADDYVTKPFRLKELAARMRAVLRRTGRLAQTDPGDDSPRTLDVSGVTLDPARREVSLAGEPLALTRKEFDLLELLMREAGRVQTRSHLIDEVWGGDYYGDTKTLDVHIKRLRQKLGADAVISTFRGVGYRFEISPP